MEQRKLIVEMHEKNATPEQIKNELDIQFGLHAYSISTVYRKVGLLKCGKNILEDEERPGRSIDEQLLYKIDQIIEEEPFASIRYIAHILNSSESTVYRYVTLYLHKIYKHTRWIPHTLTSEQKLRRVSDLKLLKNILISSQKTKWHNIITGDESMFSFSYGHKGAWLNDDDERPEFNGSKIQIQKIMVTVIWGAHGVFLIDFLPENTSFNSSYFVEYVLSPLAQKKQEIWSQSNQRKIWLHLDNCLVHNSKISIENTEFYGFKRPPHPPYSPDVALSDFFLFGYTKNKLKGHTFNDRDELCNAIIEIIGGIPKQKLKEVFEHWIHRCESVINTRGEYFHED